MRAFFAPCVVSYSRTRFVPKDPAGDRELFEKSSLPNDGFEKAIIIV